MHLLQVHYRFFIRGARVTRITGCSRPPGGVGLTPRQYTAWNVWGCARATGGLSLSRGCCLQCSVLLALGGVLPNLELELSHKEPKQQTDPRSFAQVVYIAGDTLRHQPMGTGHMTVLQFRGPITFCVLQWCHPMLTRTLWRTSCSAQMIALYGDRKRIQARALWHTVYDTFLFVEFNLIYLGGHVQGIDRDMNVRYRTSYTYRTCSFAS